MDKYDIVLDIIEHPDNYTSERLAEILSDHECRDIYNLLCKVDSVIKVEKVIDVDAEWETFAQNRAVRSRRIFAWPGSRAASIIAIIGTSVVAVAAGIAFTLAVTDSSTATMAVDEVADMAPAMSVPTSSVSAEPDSVSIDLIPVMFDDEALDTIMATIARTYGVKVCFNNKYVASLHLYYKFDPSLSLDEVVSQLNTFEQINISQDGIILNID